MKKCRERRDDHRQPAGVLAEATLGQVRGGGFNEPNLPDEVNQNGQS